MEIITSLSLPQELGNVQEKYQAQNSSSLVILIQDAHAIPDAQRNIQKIIGHFQKEYGVNLVALEGAASELDPQIFKSFPEQEVLKKTFEEYYENSEITGSAAAAILSIERGSASGGNDSPAIYQGIEAWSLYEKGLGLYQKAMEKEQEIQSNIEAEKKSLQRRKESVYSKELLGIDDALESFHANRGSLIDVIKKLAAIKAPEKGTELALLLEEANQDQKSQTPREIEVKKIAAEVKNALESSRWSKTELVSFNDKFQEFQTSRISAQAFAVFLEELASKSGLSLKVSGWLSHSMDHQKRMRDIEGTRLFHNFEHYAQSVKGLLFKNEEEKKLDRESHRLEVLQRMNRLELSREDWNQLKGMPLDASYQELLKPHFAFYKNTEARDEIFYKNLLTLMKEHDAKTSLLVAGGFHTESLIRKLKEQGISYILLTPQIHTLPENSRYREHMKGVVSWKDYYRVENGKVNLYKAFVRGTRDTLLRKSKDEYGKLLKKWRDQIIRDLAQRGKIEKVQEYTSFIDETVFKNQKFLPEWWVKLEKIIEGLRHLDSQGQWTERNISNLFKPSTHADLTYSDIAAGSILDVRYFPGVIKGWDGTVAPGYKPKVASHKPQGMKAGLQPEAGRTKLASRSVRGESGEWPDTQYGPEQRRRSEVRNGMMVEVEGNPNFKTFVVADPLFSLLEIAHGEGTLGMAVPGANHPWRAKALDFFLLNTNLLVGRSLPGVIELERELNHGDVIFLKASTILEPLKDLTLISDHPKVVGKNEEELLTELLWEEQLHLATYRLEPAIWQKIQDALLQSKLKIIETVKETMAESHETEDQRFVAFEMLAKIITFFREPYALRLIENVFPEGIREAVIKLGEDSKPTTKQIENLRKAAQRLQGQIQQRKYSEYTKEAFSKEKEQAEMQAEESYERINAFKDDSQKETVKTLIAQAITEIAALNNPTANSWLQDTLKAIESGDRSHAQIMLNLTIEMLKEERTTNQKLEKAKDLLHRSEVRMEEAGQDEPYWPELEKRLAWMNQYRFAHYIGPLNAAIYSDTFRHFLEIVAKSPFARHQDALKNSMLEMAANDDADNLNILIGLYLSVKRITKLKELNGPEVIINNDIKRAIQRINAAILLEDERQPMTTALFGASSEGNFHTVKEFVSLFARDSGDRTFWNPRLGEFYSIGKDFIDVSNFESDSPRRILLPAKMHQDLNQVSDDHRYVMTYKIRDDLQEWYAWVVDAHTGNIDEFGLGLLPPQVHISHTGKYLLKEIKLPGRSKYEVYARGTKQLIYQVESDAEHSFVEFSRDDRWLILHAIDEDHLIIDLDNPAKQIKLPGSTNTNAEIFPNGKYALVTDESRPGSPELRLYDLDEEQYIDPWVGFTSLSDISADKKILVDKDYNYSIYDMESMKRIASLRPQINYHDPLLHIIFSQDSRLILAISNSGNEIFVWSRDTKIKKAISWKEVKGGAFSADSKRMLLWNPTALRIFDLETGQVVFEMPVSSDVLNAAFANDGAHIIIEYPGLILPISYEKLSHYPLLQEILRAWGKNSNEVFQLLHKLIEAGVLQTEENYARVYRAFLENAQLAEVKWGNESWSLVSFIGQLADKGIIKTPDDFSRWFGSLRELKGSLREAIQMLHLFFTKAYEGQTPETVGARYNQIRDAGILPLPRFIQSNLSVREIQDEIQQILKGNFNIENPLHVDLNYHLLREQLETSPIRRSLSYDEFQSMIQQAKAGSLNLESPEELQDHTLQIRGLAYEAYLLREKILSIQAQAAKIGKEVIVIENLSYGAVATSPITIQDQGTKTVVGTKIPVWGTKIGSTESHHNEFVMREDLFTSAQMKFLLTRQPVVVMVDASTSVGDPGRTSPHIPDGFKGYRNHFMAMNSILGFKNEPRDFHVDGDFITQLSKDAIFAKVIRAHSVASSAFSRPYKFEFYYPGNKDLYLRTGKQKNQVAPKFNETNMRGPTAIFIQAGIEAEAVPEHIRTGFIGGSHKPAFFDDRGHFKQFYFNYEPNSGITVSSRYVLESRKAYQDLTQFLGVAIQDEKAARLSDEAAREIETIVLDLDGTIAATDKPLSGRVVAVIADLLSQGKNVIIATEDLEGRVDLRLKRLVEFLRSNSEAMSRLVVASDGGTLAYRYTVDGSKSYMQDYNGLTKITAEERTKILRLIAKYFAGSYKLDIGAGRVNVERRVDLHGVKNRNDFVRRLRVILHQAGLEYVVYKAGKTSVKIVKQHKEDFVSHFLAEAALEEQKLLIIADSARRDEIDRELLSRFSASVSVNVGEVSESIGRINPNLIQPLSGRSGAVTILESLARNHFLPLQGLLPFRALFSIKAPSYETASTRSEVRSAAPRHRKTEESSTKLQRSRAEVRTGAKEEGFEGLTKEARKKLRLLKRNPETRKKYETIKRKMRAEIFDEINDDPHSDRIQGLFEYEGGILDQWTLSGELDDAAVGLDSLINGLLDKTPAAILEHFEETLEQLAYGATFWSDEEIIETLFQWIRLHLRETPEYWIDFNEEDIHRGLRTLYPAKGDLAEMFASDWNILAMSPSDFIKLDRNRVLLSKNPLREEWISSNLGSTSTTIWEWFSEFMRRLQKLILKEIRPFAPMDMELDNPAVDGLQAVVNQLWNIQFDEDHPDFQALQNELDKLTDGLRIDSIFPNDHGNLAALIQLSLPKTVVKSEDTQSILESFLPLTGDDPAAVPVYLEALNKRKQAFSDLKSLLQKAPPALKFVTVPFTEPQLREILSYQGERVFEILEYNNQRIILVANGSPRLSNIQSEFTGADAMVVAFGNMEGTIQGHSHPAGTDSDPSPPDTEMKNRSEALSFIVTLADGEIDLAISRKGEPWNRIKGKAAIPELQKLGLLRADLKGVSVPRRAEMRLNAVPFLQMRREARAEPLDRLGTGREQSRRAEVRNEGQTHNFFTDRSEGQEVLRWIADNGVLQNDRTYLAYATVRAPQNSPRSALTNIVSLKGRIKKGRMKTPRIGVLGRNITVTKLLTPFIERSKRGWLGAFPVLLFHYWQTTSGDKRISVYQLPRGEAIDLRQRQVQFERLRQHPEAYLGEIRIEDEDRSAILSNKNLQVLTPLDMFWIDGIKLAEAKKMDEYPAEMKIAIASEGFDPLYRSLELGDVKVAEALNKTSLPLARLEETFRSGDWTHLILRRTVQMDAYNRHMIVRGTFARKSAEGHAIEESPLQFVVLLDSTHKQWTKKRYAYPPTLGTWAVGLVNDTDVPLKEKKVRTYMAPADVIRNLISPEGGAVFSQKFPEKYAYQYRSPLNTFAGERKLPGFSFPKMKIATTTIAFGNAEFGHIRWNLILKEDEEGSKWAMIQWPGIEPLKPVGRIKLSDKGLISSEASLKRNSRQRQLEKIRQVTEMHFKGIHVRGVDPWLKLRIEPVSDHFGIRPSNRWQIRLPSGIMAAKRKGNPVIAMVDSRQIPLPPNSRKDFILKPPFPGIQTKRPVLRAIDKDSGLLLYFSVEGDHRRVSINEIPEEIAERRELWTDILMTTGLAVDEARSISAHLPGLFAARQFSPLQLLGVERLNPKWIQDISVPGLNISPAAPHVLIPSQSGSYGALLNSTGYAILSSELWHQLKGIIQMRDRSEVRLAWRKPSTAQDVRPSAARFALRLNPSDSITLQRSGPSDVKSEVRGNALSPVVLRQAAQGVVDVLREVRTHLNRNEIHTIAAAGAKRFIPELEAAVKEVKAQEDREQGTKTWEQFRAIQAMNQPTVIEYNISRSELRRMGSQADKIIEELMQAAHDAAVANKYVITRIHLPAKIQGALKLLDHNQKDAVQLQGMENTLTLYNKQLAAYEKFVNAVPALTVTHFSAIQGPALFSDQYADHEEVRYEGSEGNKVAARIFTAALIWAAESLSERTFAGLVQIDAGTEGYRIKDRNTLDVLATVINFMAQYRSELRIKVAA